MIAENLSLTKFSYFDEDYTEIKHTMPVPTINSLLPALKKVTHLCWSPYTRYKETNGIANYCPELFSLKIGVRFSHQFASL